LVQGDEGPAQVVRLGHQGTPSVGYSDDGAISSPPAPYHLSAGGRWIRTFSSRLRNRDRPAVIGGQLVARIRERICGGPKVRIHLSPAVSLRTFRSSTPAAPFTTPSVVAVAKRHSLARNLSAMQARGMITSTAPQQA